MRCLQQIGQAFLAGDAADEDDDRAIQIDPVLDEHLGVRGRRVLLRIDSVVDDVQARRVDQGIAAQHVVGHPRGDRNDRVGGLDRRPLAKG